MWQKFIGAAVVCSLAGSLALQVPAEDGVGEQIGKKVDKGVNAVVSGLQKEWALARQSIEKMGVQGRVYGRLHWDKSLESSALEVEIRDGKVAVLKGRVPTIEAKQRAVELARDTVGVNSVIDELTLPAQPN